MQTSRLTIDPGLRAGGPPPALLLFGSLNLLRPLGIASIPVIVAPDDPASLVLRSRYPSGRLLLPFSDAPTERVAGALAEAGAALAGRFGRKIPLFYGSDDTLSLLYAHREELSRHYLFLLNEPEIASALIRKDEFEHLASRKDLPVPPSFAWTEEGEARVARAEFPLLVKPTRKTDWHHSSLFQELFHGKAKAMVFRNGKDLLADPVLQRFKDSLTIQRYIPGGDECIYSYHGFADENARVLASFCGRKIRTYPKLVGESCFLELIKDEALAALGERIVGALGLKGVFKIDLKRDPGEGRFYLLEINARFNLWHYLGAACGVNLPKVAYDYLVEGRRPAASEYTTGRKWLHMDLDSKAFKELNALGEISFAGWLRSIVFARKVYHVFSWRDPGPSVAWWSRFLMEKAGSWRSTAS